MTIVSEIASGVLRLSTCVPKIGKRFNHFLVGHKEPMLFHAWFKRMFPALRKAVATLVHPAKLRQITWSHFKSDEYCALDARLGCFC